MIKGAVLGSPISHSLSPLLHNAAYKELGVQGSYSAYEVKAGELQSFLNTKGSALNSLSLTMPLKEEALSIAHNVSQISHQIASGNTLHKVDDQWKLTSTDVEGLSQALLFHNITARGNLLIIGAGATARAVVAACDGVGQKITVISRSTEREKSIRSAGPFAEIEFKSWDQPLDFAQYQLVVNTTPSDAASSILNQINSFEATFFEVLYNPWPTKLLSHWKDSGGYAIDGLDLLIHQAISQIEIFSSQTIDRASIARLLRGLGEEALR